MENVPCVLEKSVYSVDAGCSVLFMIVMSSWLIGLFKSSTSLMIFCLLVFSVTGREQLNSPTYCDFVYFLFPFCQFWLQVFWGLLICTYTFKIVILSWGSDLFITISVFLKGDNRFRLFYKKSSRFSEKSTGFAGVKTILPSTAQGHQDVSSTKIQHEKVQTDFVSDRKQRNPHIK